MQVMRHDSPDSDVRNLRRWAFAALLAFAVLLGGFSVLAVFVWAAEDVPGWVTLVLGGGLAVGAAVFAWVVASALRSKN
ncbi:MAG: hypothetical protein ACRDKZ_12995 [Actinomycetota bacterium]